MLTYHEVGGCIDVLLALPGLPLWQLTDIGDGEVLQVLASTNLGIAHLAEDEEGGRNAQGNGEGDEQDAVLVGRDGTIAAPWLCDGTGVVGCEGLRQLVLLTFLQQEEVQGLLDLLLALDAEQVVGLLGIGRQLADGLTVDRLCRA